MRLRAGGPPRSRATPPRRTRAGVIAVTMVLLLAACVSDSPGPTADATPTPIPPREVTGSVVDRFTGEGVEGAELEVGTSGELARGDARGAFTFTAVPGSEVEVRATGYDPATIDVPPDGPLQVTLRPHVVSGTVIAADGAPVAGARVFVDGTRNVVETDEEGSYRIEQVPEDAALVFKAAGFALAERDVAGLESAVVDVELEPFVARALYAPAGIFDGPGRLDALLELLDTTEANALVIDVKGTDGQLYYSTDLEEAVEVDAVGAGPLLNFEEVLPMHEEQGF